MNDANLNSPAGQGQAEEVLDLQELWRVLKAHRLSVAIILFFTIAFGTVYVLTTAPTFQSTTIMMIKDDKTSAGSLVFDIGGGGAQALKNEIEILKSFSLHEAVIQQLIDSGLADDMAIFNTKEVRPRYRLLDVIREYFGGESKVVIPPKDLAFSQIIDVVDKSRQNTNISLVRDADVLKLSVLSSDSAEAVYLANSISEMYQSWDIAGGRGEIQFVLTFLDSQIAKYEDRLMEIEDELRTFKTQNQIYTLDGSAGLLLEDLTKYESVYYTNKAELEVAHRKVEYLKSQLTESEQALIEEIANTNNPMIVALRGRIAELEAQKVQQMVDEGWNEQSMQARDFNRRIDEMKARLKELTQSLILSGWSEEDPFAASQELFNRIVEQEVEVYAANSRALEYKKLVDQMAERLNYLPSQTLKLARLERERKLNENLYLTMKQKYEESRITEAGEMGKVRILDPALVASQVRPKKKLTLLLAFLVGGGLGLGYVLLIERLDNTIKSVEQLERKHLAVLGIVPDIHFNGKGHVHKEALSPSSGGKNFRRRLITYEDPKSPISEAYRTIRTNVTYSVADHSNKSVIVSSPQPGEGKSTTVANLAIAFAQLRKKTLLIDTDLRKPVQHNVFGLPRSPGITEYLVGDVDNFEDIVHETKIENLYVVTAGNLPPNPSELLGSQKMGELVDNMEHEFDKVLLDSPPIVAVTDASMVSKEIDSVLLVVKAGQTDANALDRALDTLNHVQAPLAGVILNGVRPESLGGKYSYYYSYYQYYYAEDGSRHSKSSKRRWGFRTKAQ